MNEYFDIYLLKNPDEETKLQRAIYLVTDDKFVYDSIKKKWAGVHFLLTKQPRLSQLLLLLI